MFFKHWIVILMLILILFFSLAHGDNSREGFDSLQPQQIVSDFYNANKSLHDTIIADTQSLKKSLRDYRTGIYKTQVTLRNQQLRSSLSRREARRESAFSKQIVLNMPQVKSIWNIRVSLRNLYTRFNIANISSIDQYKSMFLDVKKSITEIIANNYMPDFTTRAQGINIKIDDLVKNVDKQIMSDKTIKLVNDIRAAQENFICAVDLNPDMQYLIKDCYTSAVELSTQFIIMKPGGVEHVLYVYDGKITENCINNDCRLGDSLLIKYYIAFLPLFVMCPGSILVDTEIINYGFSLTQADIVNKTAVYTKYIDDLDKLVAFISSIKVAVEVSKDRIFKVGGSSYDDYVKYTEIFIGKITFLKETLSRELNMKNISIPVPVPINQAVFGRE